MQYPYRVKIYFKDDRSKLPYIQYVNNFLLNQTVGIFVKYNIMDRTKSSSWVGLEIGFSESVDAVNFKLGYSNDDVDIREST